MGRNRSNATAPAVKGNLVAGTGADTSGLLTVGANGTVLTADSAEATGIKWATPAAGSLTLLATTTLSGTSTVVSSISQSYKQLYVVGTSITYSGNGTFRINPNSSASNCTYAGVDSGIATQLGNCVPFGDNSEPSSSDNAFVLVIDNYTSTSRKPSQFYGSHSQNSRRNIFGGTLNHAAAITSLQYTSNSANINLGGTILLYGVN